MAYPEIGSTTLNHPSQTYLIIKDNTLFGHLSPTSGIETKVFCPLECYANDGMDPQGMVLLLCDDGKDCYYQLCLVVPLLL